MEPQTNFKVHSFAPSKLSEEIQNGEIEHETIFEKMHNGLIDAF